MFNVVFVYFNHPDNQEFRINKTLNFVPTQNMKLQFDNKPLINVINVTWAEKYKAFIVGYDFV